MSLFNRKPEELRNCAFCGGEPRLHRCGDHKEYIMYQCSRCYETPVRYDEASVCDFMARRRWNQRTEEAARVLNIHKRLMTQTTIFTASEPQQ
jgi:hypothetical protein